MARRKGRSGNRGIGLNTSPNLGADTRRPRGVRRLSATEMGRPGEPMLQSGSTKFRSVRTLIKKDISKGITQPEERQAMLTSGSVLVPGGGKAVTTTILEKSRIVPPLRNLTKVKTPRPAPGGVRNPFGRKPI